MPRKQVICIVNFPFDKGIVRTTGAVQICVKSVVIVFAVSV